MASFEAGETHGTAVLAHLVTLEASIWMPTASTVRSC